MNELKEKISGVIEGIRKQPFDQTACKIGWSVSIAIPNCLLIIGGCSILTIESPEVKAGMIGASALSELVSYGPRWLLIRYATRHNFYLERSKEPLNINNPPNITPPTAGGAA